MKDLNSEPTIQKKSKKKKSLIKAATRLVYLLLIGFIIIASGFWSYSAVQYSPLPAEFAPKTSIKIKGQILFSDIIPYFEVPEVRVFATDQQREEFIPFDSDGWFYSELDYESGQLLTFSINGSRLEPYSVFLPYEIDPSLFFDVGVFRL